MRLMDADKYIEEESEGTFLGDISIEKFNEITPTVEAIPKADYEARLKADMVAMLEELQLEIEEIVREEGGLINKKWANGLQYSEKIIQKKINSLKEQTNE